MESFKKKPDELSLEKAAVLKTKYPKAISLKDMKKMEVKKDQPNNHTRTALIFDECLSRL